MNKYLESQEFGSGKTVLILHGFLGSSDNWRQIAKIHFNTYNVHLIDLRNHGNSFHDPELNYEVMTKDVSHYINEKNLSNITLIGHSMGGKVAMQLASEVTNITSLIIVDIAPREYKPHHEDVLNALRYSNLNDATTITECENEFAKYITNKLIRLFLIKNLKRNSNKGFEWKINTNYLIDNYQNIMLNPTLSKNINIPTLFIKGEHSDYINNKDIEFIKKSFQNVKIKIINGVGHWVQAEKPLEFSNEVKGFLNEL